MRTIALMTAAAFLAAGVSAPEAAAETKKSKASALRAEAVKARARTMRGGGAVAGTSASAFALRRGGAAPVLVIPSAELPADQMATIVEDMKVMSRILEKKTGVEPARHVVFTSAARSLAYRYPSGGGSPAKAIFLQGHGAVFLLEVGFPLLPPAKKEAKPTSEPADPTWEQTKRELYHPVSDRIAFALPSPEPEQYDAEQVREFERQLFAALKHAANVRHLRPADCIIVVVTGRGGPSFGKAGSVAVATGFVEAIKQSGGGAAAPRLRQLKRSGANVLTIRVKKSDVDAFAKGGLAFDEFRKKAEVYVY